MLVNSICEPAPIRPVFRWDSLLFDWDPSINIQNMSKLCVDLLQIGQYTAI